MKKIIVIIVCLLIFVPPTYAQWFYDSQDVYVNFDVSSEIGIIPLSSRYVIETVAANVTFFPKEYNDQQLVNFRAEPEAEIGSDTVKFVWKKPKGDVLNFKINTGSRKTQSIVEIKGKIRFPLEQIPDDIKVYTKSSPTIDSDNEEIVKLASKIVEGEDDLFIAVYKIADWTKNNIDYNLSTLTADVSQKASWVLLNKQGVCDELTSLFIAMLRAVGVPARFVSGMAYTNSPLFPDSWGAHGWAEVYFPSYGWVPYDVTYGQFGFVDTTHFKFKETVDSDEGATFYSWLGKDVDIKTHELDIKTKLMGYEGNFNYGIKADASVERGHVSFGSYNIIKAKIENLNNFYVATELYLSTPKEVNITGNWMKSIALLPNQKKDAYWIVSVVGDLDGGLIYTMPVVVSTHGNNATVSFKTSIKGNFFSFEEAKNIIERMKEENSKTYSANIELDCVPESLSFYHYENKSIECILKNLGNVYLEKVNVCVEDDCETVDAGVAQQKIVKLDAPKKIGMNYITASAKNNIVSKTAQVEYEVFDEPDISVHDIKFPDRVRFNDKLNLSFTISKNSYSNPVNVSVKLYQKYLIKEIKIKELFDKHNFIVELNAKELDIGNNVFKISAAYKDKSDVDYSTGESFNISLVELTFWQKIQVKLNQLALWIAGLDIEMLVKFFVFSLLVFVVVYWYAFKHGHVK